MNTEEPEPVSTDDARVRAAVDAFFYAFPEHLPLLAGRFEQAWGLIDPPRLCADILASTPLSGASLERVDDMAAWWRHRIATVPAVAASTHVGALVAALDAKGRELRQGPDGEPPLERFRDRVIYELLAAGSEVPLGDERVLWTCMGARRDPRARAFFLDVMREVLTRGLFVVTWGTDDAPTIDGVEMMMARLESVLHETEWEPLYMGFWLLVTEQGLADLEKMEPVWAPPWCLDD